MKKLILFLHISHILPIMLLAQNDEILSTLKKEQIKIEYKKAKESANKLSKDWINPINISFSEDENFNINLNQPIFKSGGINYAIKYANANELFNNLSIKLQEKELIHSAIKLLYSIKKLNLQIDKQKLLIENAKIDVIRKKEQFEAGLLDSSFLDNTILNKNSLENSLFEFENSKFELIKSFKDLSDLNYNELIPPKFGLISQEEFLSKNLELQKATYNIAQEKHYKNGIVSTFLPTISLKANYTNDYENYLAVISMPIDFNMYEKIELAKLDYLKAKLDYEDKKRAENNQFENILKRVEVIEKKISLAKSDYNLYNLLLSDTKIRFDVGDKSIYDVDTLKNSRDTKVIDEKILKIDRELELSNLYFKI